jgi:hypothetical protein
VDLLDQLLAADVGVVGESLVADGNGLEHAAGRYLKGCMDIEPVRAFP